MENTTYTVGGVDLILDPKGILESFKALDKLDASDLKKIAVGLELKVEPFDKALVKPIIMGAIQSEWYTRVQGAVPEKVAASQAKRVARYAEQVEELNSSDPLDLVTVRKRKTPAAAATPRAVNLYRLTEAGAKMEFEHQKFVVAQTLLENDGAVGGKGMSTRDVFEKQKKYPGIKHTGDNNVKFHMLGFVKAGIIEQVGPDGAVIERKATEAPAPAQEAEPTPEPAAKKKSSKKSKK